MSFYPFSPLAGLELQATTGITGFALQDATPTILTWTAPDDGGIHSAQILSTANVASTETGGQLGVSWTGPDGTTFVSNFLSAGQSSGLKSANLLLVVKYGTAVTLSQLTALTGGAATLWAVIWGS